MLIPAVVVAVVAAVVAAVEPVVVEKEEGRRSASTFTTHLPSSTRATSRPVTEARVGPGATEATGVPGAPGIVAGLVPVVEAATGGWAATVRAAAAEVAVREPMGVSATVFSEPGLRATL
jgi:hypothetical protein